MFAFVFLAATSAASIAPKSARVRGALFGALTADALSLGSHYEYDAPKIKKAYGGKTIDRFYAPGESMGGMTHGVGWGARKYHDKVAGEMTDYGDYNVLVLEHLATTASDPRRLSVSEIIPHWQRRMQNWKAWMCTQTRQTLQQVRQGVPHNQLGGMSNAMSVRSASLFAYHDDEEDIVASARAAMFTHKETSAHQGNEFFARVTHRIVHDGATPREAIDAVTALPGTSSFIKQKVAQAITKYEEATDPSSSLSKQEFVDDLAVTSMARLWDVGKTEPIKVGKASPTEGTLPASIYLILKYANDFAAAVAANAMVGGDNASRSIAIGMVLGAYHGVGAIPEKWRNELKEYERFDSLLSSLPVLKALDAKTEL